MGEVGPHGHARAAAIVQQRSMPQSDIHQGYNGLSYYPPQQQDSDRMDTMGSNGVNTESRKRPPTAGPGKTAEGELMVPTSMVAGAVTDTFNSAARPSNLEWDAQC